MRAARARQVFDRVATGYSRYDESPVARRISGNIVDGVRASMVPGSRIADIGCGPGSLAVALAQHGFDVTASDISSPMLTAAAEAASAQHVVVETINHDIGEGPLPGGPYDGLIATMGPINYTDSPGQYLRNIRASVCTGGCLWLGLARAASFPRVIRQPRILLGPLVRNKPSVLHSSVQGAALDIYVWDPIRFVAEFGAGWRLVELRGLGLSPRLPHYLNHSLERTPGLRRLGSVSLLTLEAT